MLTLISLSIYVLKSDQGPERLLAHLVNQVMTESTSDVVILHTNISLGESSFPSFAYGRALIGKSTSRWRQNTGLIDFERLVTHNHSLRCCELFT